MINSLSIILILLSVILLAGIILLYSKHKNVQTANENEKKELSQLQEKITLLNSERTQLEEAKKTFEEKNKKLWSMSEAVHKEKHKVDSQNETLLAEKEKLQLEKSKVDEKIKKLWQQSTAIHKEKEKINQLKIEVEFKHKEIVDSVNYAKRIQEAILPPIEDISEFFKESFVLFKPRDIVSGDFYWFYQKNDIAVIAACDCTGHGVPGAFMSMIGNTLLNQIVIEKGNISPAKILTLLNEAVRKALKQSREGNESRDGMDLALCVIDKSENKLTFAGANRPLYYFDNSKSENTFGEIKPSKFPIGGHDFDGKKVYTESELENIQNLNFYIFTDGYADQFGGTKGKKYMLKNLQRTFEDIQASNLSEQMVKIDDSLENWKTGFDQVDDVLVIGFKI
jgi:serine phosphatase RsbU (regulator of sigma subunit)